MAHWAMQGLTFFSDSLGVWRKRVRGMVLGMGVGDGGVDLNEHTKGLPPGQWNLNNLKQLGLRTWQVLPSCHPLNRTTPAPLGAHSPCCEIEKWGSRERFSGNHLGWQFALVQFFPYQQMLNGRVHLYNSVSSFSLGWKTWYSGIGKDTSLSHRNTGRRGWRSSVVDLPSLRQRTAVGADLELRT